VPEISHIIKLKSLGEIYSELQTDEFANGFLNSPKIEQFTDDLHSGQNQFLNKYKNQKLMICTNISFRGIFTS
jgi:hypothetical protein